MGAYFMDIASTGASVSGVIYVFQVLSQVYLYGFRGWWHFGLGTGREVERHNWRRKPKS